MRKTKVLAVLVNYGYEQVDYPQDVIVELKSFSFYNHSNL